jgi:glycine/D-amino acid oxidase-like deaminating enzyme
MTESKKQPKSADVVVIGGGIVGTSTAWFLARQGLNVALCEKGLVAGEQSSRNWGFIRKQGRNPREIPLMVHSLEIWEDLTDQQKKNIGFHKGGTLYLSETEKRYQANQAWLEHAKTFGLDSRFLSPVELKTLIPEMQEQKRGALYTPSDARAEPELATRAIANIAQSCGAAILEQCAVRGIDVEAGRVSGVVTEHGRIKTSTVVCAGGAWSGYFCRHLDIVFPHLKVISSVMATEATSFSMQQSLWSSGLGMRKRQDGGYSIAFGGSSDCEITPDFIRFCNSYISNYLNSKETVSLKLGSRFFKELSWPKKWSFDHVTVFEKERMLDPAPNEKLLNEAYKLLGQNFPSLQNIAIAKKWAGMIDVTPDELPVISEVSDLPGLIISTGFSGHGFGIGPGAGKVTAELATGGETAVDISCFSLSRLRK